MAIGQRDSDRVGTSMSSMEFRLDPASGVPTYLQLVHQVEHALRLGYLKIGDQLPKVRDVVASLAINPNTVSKAYRELETKGLIVGRPGQGTFILATLSQVALPELTGLRRSLHGWLAKADTAGLDESGIAALFASELRDFSLAIPAGRVAALVGPNGSGKTTLLSLAAGLAVPSLGGVTVLGGRPP